MSNLEHNITSYFDEYENVTLEEQLELSSLHASLISDVEGEYIVTEVKSAPSSPSSLAFRDISPLRTSSTPSSPSRHGSSVIPRTSSVKALVSQFNNNQPSIMADKAKKEAADSLRKISYCKGWVTKYFNQLDTLLITGEDTLNPNEFKSISDKLQIQFDKMLSLRDSIGDVYAKHNVEAQGKVILEDIETCLNNFYQKVKDLALKVDRGGAAALVPENDNITKAELLQANGS